MLGKLTGSKKEVPIGKPYVTITYVLTFKVLQLLNYRDLSVSFYVKWRREKMEGQTPKVSASAATGSSKEVPLDYAIEITTHAIPRLNSAWQPKYMDFELIEVRKKHNKSQEDETSLCKYRVDLATIFLRPPDVYKDMMKDGSLYEPEITRTIEWRDFEMLSKSLVEAQSSDLVSSNSDRVKTFVAVSYTKNMPQVVLTSYEWSARQMEKGMEALATKNNNNNEPDFASMTAAEAAEYYSDKIKALYMKHCPQKIGHVDALLNCFHGEEETLYHKLVEKYEAEMSSRSESKAETTDDQKPMSYALEDTETTIWIRTLDKRRAQGKTGLEECHKAWLKEKLCIANLISKRQSDKKSMLKYMEAQASEEAKVEAQKAVDEEYMEEFKMVEEEHLRKLRIESSFYQSEKRRLEEEALSLQGAMTQQVLEMRELHAEVMAKPKPVKETPTPTEPQLPRLVHEVLQQQSVVATQHVLILKQLEQQQDTLKSLQRQLEVTTGLAKTKGIVVQPDYFEDVKSSDPVNNQRHLSRTYDLFAVPDKIEHTPLPMSSFIPR
eukprot:PhF_6_TR3702/c0_g1_i1/m.5282